MGVLTEVLALVRSAGMEARLFMVAGGPGAFTAFSTFLPDFVALYERGRWLLCAVYVVASVVPSIGAPFAGLHVMRRALGPTI